jgi:hypothetical protein
MVNHLDWQTRQGGCLVLRRRVVGSEHPIAQQERRYHAKREQHGARCDHTPEHGQMNDNGNAQFQLGEHMIAPENIGQHARQLGQRRRSLAANGFVHLMHCKVGQDPLLLFMLSSIVGLRVYAGTGGDLRGMNLGTYTRAKRPSRMRLAVLSAVTPCQDSRALGQHTQRLSLSLIPGVRVFAYALLPPAVFTTNRLQTSPC